MLRTIHLGFVTLALEHKADQIRDLLGATRTEMLKMDEVLERLAQTGRRVLRHDRARAGPHAAVGRKLRGVEAVEAGAGGVAAGTEPEIWQVDGRSGGNRSIESMCCRLVRSTAGATSIGRVWLHDILKNFAAHGMPVPAYLRLGETRPSRYSVVALS